MLPRPRSERCRFRLLVRRCREVAGGQSFTPACRDVTSGRIDGGECSAVAPHRVAAPRRQHGPSSDPSRHHVPHRRPDLRIQPDPVRRRHAQAARAKHLPRSPVALAIAYVLDREAVSEGVPVGPFPRRPLRGHARSVASPGGGDETSPPPATFGHRFAVGPGVTRDVATSRAMAMSAVDLDRARPDIAFTWSPRAGRAAPCIRSPRGTRACSAPAPAPGAFRCPRRPRRQRASRHP